VGFSQNLLLINFYITNSKTCLIFVEPGNILWEFLVFLTIDAGFIDKIEYISCYSSFISKLLRKSSKINLLYNIKTFSYWNVCLRKNKQIKSKKYFKAVNNLAQDIKSVVSKLKPEEAGSKEMDQQRVKLSLYCKNKASFVLPYGS
jgi:hypothetical protein